MKSGRLKKTPMIKLKIIQTKNGKKSGVGGDLLLVATLNPITLAHSL